MTVNVQIAPSEVPQTGLAVCLFTRIYFTLVKNLSQVTPGLPSTESKLWVVVVCLLDTSNRRLDEREFGSRSGVRITTRYSPI